MVSGEEGHIHDNVDDVDGPNTVPSRFVSVRLVGIETKKSTVVSVLNKKRRTSAVLAGFVFIQEHAL